MIGDVCGIISESILLQVLVLVLVDGWQGLLEGDLKAACLEGQLGLLAGLEGDPEREGALVEQVLGGIEGLADC